MSFPKIQDFGESFIITNTTTNISLKLVPHVASRGNNKGKKRTFPSLSTEHKPEDIRLFLGDVFDQFLVDSFNFWITHLWRYFKGNKERFVYYLENNGKRKKKQSLDKLIEEINELKKNNEFKKANLLEIELLTILQKKTGIEFKYPNL